MATYEQVMDALRTADAEGNVDDARRLAEIAVSMRPQGAGGGRGLVGGPTAEGQARGATSTGEYLLESIKRGLTSLPARLTSGSAASTGTFAGAFPTQPELEEFTPQRVQQMMGVDTNIRPTTPTQKYGGAFLEGAFDPLNLMGAGTGILSKGTQLLSGGLAGVGGEFGGEVGKQAFDSTGEIIGGITFALLSGSVGLKGAESVLRKVNTRGMKVADLAEVEGLSRAQDLISKALEANPGLMRRLDEIQKRVKFVTGEEKGIAVTGIDSDVFRGKLQQLAEKDLTVRADLTKLYDDLQAAVKAKTQELYPTAGKEIPSATQVGKAVETDYNKRIDSINNQLAKLTSDLNISGNVTPVDLGTPIQNLVKARELAARNALSPEYNSVKEQASKQGAILPAQDTQDLLNTAFDLFQKDPWGRQSDLLRLVQQQSNKFKGLRQQVNRVEPGTTLPATTAPDLTVGMDITSLDSLKRRVAEDIRKVQNPATKDKLIVLQQRVDEALNKVENASGGINVNFRGEQVSFGEAMSRLDTDYYNKVGIPFKDADAIQKINSQEYAEKIAPQIASSPTSLNQFLRVAGNEGVPLAERAVMSRLYNQALGKDGVIDQVKLQNLLTKDSNNGGYRDILENLPGLKNKLQDVSTRSQALVSERMALNDASTTERVRIGNSFLQDYENGGVERIVSNMTNATGKGYRNRFMADLNKLGADDKVNVQLAIRNQLATNMVNSNDPFGYLNKNKDAFITVFGKDHVNQLEALADVSRLSQKIDINKLPIRDSALSEMSAMQRMLGGVEPERVSAVLVNGIYSTLQKAYRILGAVGKSNIDEATRQAHIRLFFDPAGLKAINEASARIISKDGKDINLKTVVSPKDVSKIAGVFGQNVLRSGYVGASTAMSPSTVMEEQKEPYFIYQPD
jgi:hypothetical protein